MEKKAEVVKFTDGGKYWENRFDSFTAKVFIPATELPQEVINFGFDAPYLIVFDEKNRTAEEVKVYAEETGLAEIAAQNASSVVMITPNTDGGWEKASEEIFEELIANSKIHQYYEDGMAVLVNRFTKGCDGYAIRSAIYRTFVFGEGSAADYIAKYLLKTINGQGLWGPADVTPVVCFMKNLSVVPVFERNDIPVVSIGNSAEINEAIKAGAKDSLILDGSGVDLYGKAYDSFAKKYLRWVGTLDFNHDFEAMGMVKETGVIEVTTTPENRGDFAGSETHPTGYVAYYNKSLFENGPAPLLLAFHGGGDSAMHIAESSNWCQVAHDHNFLLVAVENHLNTTAGEVMELLAHLCDRYNVDGSRIYASGFSMGGCKSWDLYQEYPDVFAGLAPMSATFEVGLNAYGEPAPVEINADMITPIFYVGGEITPLPELPFQAQKCLDRMGYVLRVNQCKAKYEVKLEEAEKWAEPIFGIAGDTVEKIDDPSRGSVLTVNYFESVDGIVYTAFGSVSGQGHECRYHSCENAWKFLSGFRRNEEGKIVRIG